jgi:hypothetical protein
MNIGDYVSNVKAPQYGPGKVIAVDRQYLTVYFELLNEEKDFSVLDHPLKKTIGPKNGQKVNILKRSSEKNDARISKKLDWRVDRDNENVSLVAVSAKDELQKKGVRVETADFVGGITDEVLNRQKSINDEIRSLGVVLRHPFHAMMEVNIVTSKASKYGQLVYANEHTNSNLPGLTVPVLAWTHPIVQLSLSADLNEENDIRAKGYTLKSVTPIARAKFSQIQPRVAGLYEPGGSIQGESARKVKSGLKAVKLDMTKDQVDAFLSRMNGMMLVSGAPGSGKTTVAMQRIRFLYDQQEIRREELKNVTYSPELTKVFLANQNLIDYSKKMLEEDLHIPSSIVELVSDFVGTYLDDLWAYKHGAKLRRKKLLFFEERGRQAFFGLCNVSQLRKCWESYEEQIAERFSLAADAPWGSTKGQNATDITTKLANAFRAYSKKRIASNPSSSMFRMDTLYKIVGSYYEELREIHRGNGSLQEFDLVFQQWLYWVYDPLDGIKAYFLEDAYAGKIRIKSGIAAKIDENDILERIKEGWDGRSYGKEEEPWLAFLLRFALPTEKDHKSRFREIANPLDITYQNRGDRWTHIMVDEAQDLCVPEAALLGSFVHPDGAFTVSADFHQIVSPVWGMENSEAFNVGNLLNGGKQIFPFAKNMRQSKQIGLFLREFYQSAFGEIAPFEANDAMDLKNKIPLLMLCGNSEIPVRIKQRLKVMSRDSDIRTVALLQINEDENSMLQIRVGLEREGVELASIWAPSDKNNRLITTSVERIKGLEYDACFVVGMDDVDNSNLNYSKNRAYVALSRPSYQLTIFCEEIPSHLQKIKRDYINIIGS